MSMRCHSACERRATARAAALALWAMAALAGCAQVSDRVVLLPDSQARPTAVVVTTPQGATVLDKPFTEARVSGGQAEVAVLSPEQVRERYGDLLATVPQRAQAFILYFEAGANELTAASRAEVQRMRDALSQRAAAEVLVIGHTDRVGSIEANDRLSRERAQMVRGLLVAAGVPVAAISVAGRGEREPLVATADEVAEPRNRRVEIKLR